MVMSKKNRAQKAAALAAARARRHVLPNATGAAPPLPAASTPVATSAEPSAEETLIPLRESASKRKLSYFESSSSAAADASTTTVVQLSCLQPLFEGLLCPDCGTNSVAMKVADSQQAGLSVLLQTVCRNTRCEATVISSVNTSAKLDDGKTYDINRRVVAASLAVGMGRERLCKFSECMGMPQMHSDSYNAHVKSIHHEMDSYKLDVRQKAMNAVRRAHNIMHTDCIDLKTSYDGSWQTRGHKSNNGLGCGIENKTGLCVDHVTP